MRTTDGLRKSAKDTKGYGKSFGRQCKMLLGYGYCSCGKHEVAMNNSDSAAKPIELSICDREGCHHSNVAHCNLKDGLWSCCFCLCENFIPDLAALTEIAALKRAK